MLKDAVVIVVFDQRTGLMLAVHRKDDVTKWGIPGGKVDADESPLEAIIRELGEETPYVALINNIKYLGPRPCCGFIDYNVHAYMVKDASLLKINLSLMDVEQNYGWVHPRLLTVGPFGDFNKKLFTEFGDVIFGKLADFFDWHGGLPSVQKLTEYDCHEDV